MLATEIAEVIDVALGKVPGKRPRIVRDNGSQFIAQRLHHPDSNFGYSASTTSPRHRC